MLVALVLIPVLWPRLSGSVFEYQLHFQPTEHYGRTPDEIQVLSTFLNEKTAFGDIVLTNIDLGNHGHLRYPFPAYEYLSNRRVQPVADLDDLRRHIIDFKGIQNRLDSSNPAKTSRFYLLIEEGHGSKDFVELGKKIAESSDFVM